MLTMNKTNPFKRELLRYLLEYCYPSDQAEGFGRYAGGSDYLDDPRTQELRDAVINVLRAYISGGSASKKAVLVFERVLNEPVKLARSIYLTNPPLTSSLFGLKSTFSRGGRNVVSGLLDYLNESGPTYAFVCETCQKISQRLKPNQRFCSDQCRWDFWNESRGSKRLKKARKRGK